MLTSKPEAEGGWLSAAEQLLEEGKSVSKVGEIVQKAADSPMVKTVNGGSCEGTYQSRDRIRSRQCVDGEEGAPDGVNRSRKVSANVEVRGKKTWSYSLAGCKGRVPSRWSRWNAPESPGISIGRLGTFIAASGDEGLPLFLAFHTRLRSRYVR